MKRAWLIASVVAAACGDNTTGEVRVHFAAAGPPDFVSYRLADTDPWSAAAVAGSADGDLIYTFDADDAYELVSGCSHGDLRVVLQTRSSVDEAPDVGGEGCAIMVSAAHVSGSMVQPGAVWSESLLGSGTTSPWSFHDELVFGTTADLVAVGRDRAAIRRGVALADPDTLPAFDVDQEGAALQPATIAIDGAGSDAVVAEIDYESQTTTTTTAPLSANAVVSSSAVAAGASAVTLAAFPDALRASGDAEQAGATAGSAAGSRSVYVALAAATHLTVPPPVDASFDDATHAVTWGDIPGAVDAELDLGGVSFVRLQAGRAWIAAHGSELAFDTSYPDFDPSIFTRVRPPSLFVDARPNADTDIHYFFSEPQP